MVISKFTNPVDCKDELMTNFFKVNINDINKLINADIKTNMTDRFKIYYYILARIKRRSEDDIKDISVTGGKAEVFFDNYENICKDLCVSRHTFCRCIKELQGLELISYGNIGFVIKNKSKQLANNVYAINNLELSYGLRESALWYVENNYKITYNKN